MERWLKMESSVCVMGDHIGTVLGIRCGEAGKGNSSGYGIVLGGSSPS